METQISLKEFRKVIPAGTPQDDESHHAWGAILYWKREGKIYEEHQPDIPTADNPVRWFVRTLPRFV